jgi:hypothetical protein
MMQEKIFEAKGRFWLLLFIKRTKMILLMSIGLLTISCKAPTGPTQELMKEIQGTVSDALDNSPICGASVELMKITGMTTSATLASTLTDNSGFYHLKYIFQDKKDCDDRSITLLVGYNLFNNIPRIYKFKNIAYYDTPHVYCAEGLQGLDVTLDRW